jgi:hypothetical protein
MTPATAALEPHVEVTPHTIEETGVDETDESVPSLRQKETISPSVPPKNPPSLPLQSALSLLSPSLPAPALSHPLPSATMANFAVHPEPFIPPVMFVEDGRPQRRVRHEIYVRGGVPKTHEDYTIAVVDDNLSITERHQLLHDITNLVVTQYHLNVRFFALHTHGVGILRLRNACQRDALIALNPHLVGQREVTFFPHDEVPINFRRMSFTRKCWIMLQGYPLDFKDATTLVEVCTPFARVLHWNSEDTSMSRVLLKVLVEDHREIPRDVVIKMGRESDGEGRSWTVPIYIFNSEILPDGPSDEEDPP